MKKFLIPFAISASVALAVQYFQKDKPASAETDTPATTETSPVVDQK